VADWSKDLELAEKAARAAGAIVMKAFRTEQEVTFKSADQPLTQADLDSDAAIKTMLLDARPGYGWLSEETADNPARLGREMIWLVDPIDGTRSFVAGRPEFTICIGLVQNDRAVAGVVYNPATDELFSATLDGGARKNGAPLHARKPHERPRIAASRSEIARGDFTTFEADCDVLPTGSTAYKMARVAEGTVDAFFSRGPKSEWDVCAAMLIAEEAGCKVTDLAGARLHYNQPDPHIDGVLAATPGLHESLLERLRRL
jgi:myo-inositol-1(or 4)-monophosphatase